MQIAFEIVLNIGCRLRETRFPANCIDFDEGKITFPSPKGGEERPKEARADNLMSNALMNVLLCSLGSHGDVHPYLALGKELLQRGHTVTFATSSHYRNVHRLGCGRILRRDRLLERSLARELQALLADDGLAAAAREEGRLIQGERGAEHAAEVLLRRFA